MALSLGSGWFPGDSLGRAVEFTDLLDALEATSGRDLRAWANAWLQTSGVNTLSAKFTLDDEGRYLKIAPTNPDAPVSSTRMPPPSPTSAPRARRNPRRERTRRDL